jgi:sugar phosphate isomerase/epimerase
VPRVSLSQVTTWSWPFERDVAAAAAARVDGLGVSVRKLEAVGVGRAARLLGDAGLGVACLTASGPLPLADPTAERAACVRIRDHLAAAAELRAGCLMLLAGNDPTLAWEEAAARARALLDAVLADAARWGVRVAIEPTSQLRMDLSFLHGFDEALDFVDAWDARRLGVVLELNHAWIERRLYENIRARVARIALVQVSDFKVGTRCTGERLVPGDGDVPLGRIVGALAAAGYDGWYDVELLGPAIEREGYASVVTRAVARVRALIAPLASA